VISHELRARVSQILVSRLPSASIGDVEELWHWRAPGSGRSRRATPIEHATVVGGIADYAMSMSVRMSCRTCCGPGHEFVRAERWI